MCNTTVIEGRIRLNQVLSSRAKNQDARPIKSLVMVLDSSSEAVMALLIRRLPFVTVENNIKVQQ